MAASGPAPSLLPPASCRKFSRSTACLGSATSARSPVPLWGDERQPNQGLFPLGASAPMSLERTLDLVYPLAAQAEAGKPCPH